MNALVVGAPRATLLSVARALRATDQPGPLTMVSDDADGLLAALDEPGLADVEVLRADPGEPTGCDDAVVHRQLLHGPPDVVVVVVDDEQDSAWDLGAQLARRLPTVPFLVTGRAADEVRDRADVLAAELAREFGAAPPWAVHRGDDAASLAEHLSLLLATAAGRPAPTPTVPVGHAHCPH